MSYLVTAACVIAQDQDGKLHHHYEDDVIAWLSDEQAEHFVSSGLVEETDSDPGGSEPVDEPDDTNGKPAEDAKKADLVEWVLTNALKEDGSEYAEAELNRLTKDELWALINSVPDESDDAGSEA